MRKPRKTRDNILKNVLLFENNTYSELKYTIIIKNNSNMYNYYQNFTTGIIKTSYICNIASDIFQYKNSTEQEFENCSKAYSIINKNLNKRIKYLDSSKRDVKNYVIELLNLK